MSYGLLITHHFSLVTSVFPHRPSTFAEEKIAVPRGVKRAVERVDSDQQRRGLLEAAQLHVGAGQKVDGADGGGILLVLLHNPPERRLGLHEAAALVEAEGLAIVV